MDFASFERKGEKKKEVGCRKHSRCRGSVMKGRDMRSSVSRTVTDEGALQKNCGCAYSNEMLLAEIG